MVGSFHLRRGARLAFAMFVGLLLPAATASLTQNDAGSGADAGNTPDASLRLRDPGAWTGTLPANDPADWYSWKFSSVTRPWCVEAGATSDALLQGTFSAISAAGTREASFLASPVRTGFVGLAGLDIKGAYLGIEDYIDAGSTAYGFSFKATSGSTGGDGGTGADAPSTPSGAPRVPSGCFGGTLSPSRGDAADVYRFDASAGDSIVFTIASVGDGAKLSLLSASGAVLASIDPSMVGTFSIDSPGTYSLSTSSSSDSAYAIGLCGPICGPPEQPCEPMCRLDLEGSS